MSREFERLPPQEEVEARLQDLNRQQEELRDEIRKVTHCCLHTV